MLNVLDCGVGLDIGVDLIGDLGGIEKVGHLGRDAELHEVGVGGNEGFLEAAGRNLVRDLGDGARSVIRRLVEHDALNHWSLLSTPT